MPLGLLPADFIPGYCFLREIHRGGQGVVYEATQLATRRRVAIKVIRPTTTDRSAAQARFEREAELLTQLRHPNIVTVHDAGVSTDTFFIVMDFVDGVPLDQFVRSREIAHVGRRAALPARGKSSKSSFESVLRVFACVCDAVNAAHLRGIIHRDLKPANILVDRDGAPRVLDFGLAKLVADPAQTVSSNVETLSIPGGFLGSLPWASPEQAAGKHATIDIRTDVYSLGVILYQLLTGRFPYDVTGPMRDVLNRIGSAEPVRPRSISPASIDNEMETIVLKCLAKEPARRYQSAGDLAADIRRYLAGDPIEAKRDSAMYVLRKTLRRYRVPAAIAAAFVLLILCGIVVSTVLWQQSEGAREAEAWQRARAEAISAFLQETLALANPMDEFLDAPPSAARLGRVARDRKVVDALDHAASDLDEGRFKHEPLTEAALRLVIGRVYDKLHQTSRAESQLRRAYEITLLLLGP